MNLESLLKSAIANKDTSQLESLKALAAEELPRHKSKNYPAYIRSLITDLEKLPAKKQAAAVKTTSASNFFS